MCVWGGFSLCIFFSVLSFLLLFSSSVILSPAIAIVDPCFYLFFFKFFQKIYSNADKINAPLNPEERSRPLPPLHERGGLLIKSGSEKAST